MKSARPFAALILAAALVVGGYLVFQGVGRISRFRKSAMRCSTARAPAPTS
jgi:hypothetical protein